nr:gluconokinase [uncultured Microbacterium sp.]
MLSADLPLDVTSDSPVLVFMGVAGSGKSTAASLLAARLGWDFAEGDDLHPAANVAKMAAGHPLDDDDRAPWLRLIADWIDAHVAAGRPGIVTCSALRRRYRDVLRHENVVFVHFTGDRALILERMQSREGHFMPTALLDSQLATLEPLDADERHIDVDIALPPEAQLEDISRRLGLHLDDRN